MRLLRATPYRDASSPGSAGGRRVVEVEWHALDALPFSLCISNAKTKEPLSVARGNVVLVDQGLTVGPERLADVPRGGRYRPRLGRRPLTHAQPLTDERSPASLALSQDAHAALPSIALAEPDSPQGPGARWTARQDLLRSKPGDRDFVVEVDDRGAASLRFGDGALGALPAPAAALSATYRIGNGAAGNVGPGAIAHLVVTDSTLDTSRIRRVTNPLATAGGTDPETLDHVRVTAPQSFRVQERAVTERDHAAAAERFPTVRKAASFRRFLGAFDAHVLSVLRAGGLPVDDPFKADLRAFLESFRLSGTELLIEPPTFVKIDVLLRVRVADGHLRNAVHAALLAAFSKLDLLDGRRGFFHPDNFSFGQPVFLGQVVRAIMDVGGVASVDTTAPENRFRRHDRAVDDIERGRIFLGPLEIASAGAIDFHLEGGL